MTNYEQTFEGEETISYVIDYGTFRIIAGTLEYVCGILKGTNVKYTDFFWDTTNIIAVQPL